MEGVLQMIGIGKTQESETAWTKQQEQILSDLREVNRQIACNERWFQMESNEDLIEACIYQRESLQAQYRHLMNRAKRASLYCSPFELK